MAGKLLRSPRMTFLSRAWAASILLAGCSTGQIQLTLVPTVSSAADVASRVRVIQVVVGSPEGLAGVTSAGPRSAGGVATDWNGDGRLEVVFSTDHAVGQDFPVLEIGLGDNGDRDLEFRVLGFGVDPAAVPTARPVAYGGTTLRPSNAAVKLGVPFDLRPEARAPAVVLVLPPDGTGVPSTLASVTLAFSTVLDEGTLGAIHVSGPSGDRAIQITAETATLSKGTPIEEKRSVLTLRFVPATLLDDGEYAISVGSGVLSAAGLAAAPFSSRFAVGALDVPSIGCDGGTPCAGDSSPDASVSGSFPDAGAGDSFPGPSLSTGYCACTGGWVCDSDWQDCIPSCQAYGCASAGTVCDGQSGLCR